MKKVNTNGTMIEKMREIVLNNEESINIILGITKLPNYKNKYRKYMRLEAYSLVSKHRFWQRVENNIFTSYNSKLICVLENADIIKTDNIEILFANECFLDFEKLYDIEAIKKQFGIDILFTKTKMILNGNNELQLCRFGCLVLCDFIDLNLNISLKCDERYIESINKLINQKIIFDFSYADFYNLNNNYKTLCSLCGFELISNKVLVEPYRAEVCTFSQVLSDIIDISISWPISFKKVSGCGRGYELLYSIQSLLNANGYCNCDLIKQSSCDNKALEKLIIEYEIKNRNIKQPHKNCCITETLNLSANSNILIWSSGKKLNINCFADEMRNIIIKKIGKSVKYNSMGKKIVFRNDSKVIAEIWSVDDIDGIMEKFNIFNLVIAKIVIDKEK